MMTAQSERDRRSRELLQGVEKRLAGRPLAPDSDVERAIEVALGALARRVSRVQNVAEHSGVTLDTAHVVAQARRQRPAVAPSQTAAAAENESIMVFLFAAECARDPPGSRQLDSPGRVSSTDYSMPKLTPATPSRAEPSKAALQGRLLAQPGTPTTRGTPSGKLPLGLSDTRDGYLYVPARPDGPFPLVVFFHGAGGDAGQAAPLLPLAEEHGALVLSIDSRGSSWDLIEGQLGADVEFLDAALRLTFARFPVDPSRLAAAGFSDGASYALSLGLANGALFTQVLAFSPGFASPPQVSGQPTVFVSHGTVDGVLPIDSCSRRIVPRLQRQGYVVQYREFDGGHSLPRAILLEAFEWMM